MSFIKHDEGKTRLGLIAPDFVEVVGRVLTFGAKKYADWNWVKGAKWSRFYDSALRHINAWGSGETLDDETGLPHLAHAACCLMFLIVYHKRGLGVDDRWIPPAETVKTLPVLPVEYTCGGIMPAPNAIEIEAAKFAGKWVDLFCPFCQARHVDTDAWAQRLHHTHLCAYCGEEWSFKAYLFGRAEVCEGCGNARGHAASATCPGYKAHCDRCGANDHNTGGLMCPKTIDAAENARREEAHRGWYPTVTVPSPNVEKEPVRCKKGCGRLHHAALECPKD